MSSNQELWDYAKDGPWLSEAAWKDAKIGQRVKSESNPELNPSTKEEPYSGLTVQKLEDAIKEVFYNTESGNKLFGQIDSLGKEQKEAVDKAFKDYIDNEKGWRFKNGVAEENLTLSLSPKSKKVFANENGTVYQGDDYPERAGVISLQGANYWCKIVDINCLQDFLNLRVQETSNETTQKSAEREAMILNPNLKKSRNKMTHLTPKKKKRK